MGTEIERKFVVTGDGWRQGATGVAMRQGYLVTGPPVSVRVRIAGEDARLNIKKAVGEVTNIVRHEFEYPIPLADAEAMLDALAEGHSVEKTRYRVDYQGALFEVDVFEGLNAGLVVAEIELETPEQAFPKPPWLGEEVSGNRRYLNSALSITPFSSW